MSRQRHLPLSTAFMTAVFSLCLVPMEASLAKGTLGGVRDAVRSDQKSKRDDNKRSRKDDDDGNTLSFFRFLTGGNKKKDNDHRPHRDRHRSGRSHRDHTVGFHFDYHSPPPVVIEEHMYVHDLPSAYGPSGPVYVPLEGPPPAPSPIVDVLVQSPLDCPTPLVDIDSIEPWVTRLGVQYGSDFEDISQGGLDMLFQSPGGLGLDGSLRIMRESWAPDERDHLWVGDVNVVYEVFPGENLRLRLGVGFNWLGDSLGAEFGPNLTAGFDWLLGRYWAAAGDVDLGTLGDADLFHARLTTGPRFDSVEWIWGIDHYAVGGVEVNSLITGLQFRY